MSAPPAAAPPGSSGLPRNFQVIIHSLIQQTLQSKTLSQDLEKVAKDAAAEPPKRTPSRFSSHFETNVHINTGSSLRRSSITSVSSAGSGAGGSSRSLAGNNLPEMSASVLQSGALSPTTEGRDEGTPRRVFGGPAYTGEGEEEELEEEEEEAFDGGKGAIAGVKWGEYVEFVLPPEVEVRRRKGRREG